MVRLTELYRRRPQIGALVFQFRNGSINSDTTSPQANRSGQFQFRNGSINRRMQNQYNLPANQNFNSAMVRLTD